MANFSETKEEFEVYEVVGERGYERLFVSDGDVPCLACGTLTHWAFLSLNGIPICSHECADEMWNRYLEKIREQCRQEVEQFATEDESLTPVIFSEREVIH